MYHYSMILSGGLVALNVLLEGIFGPLVKDILSTYTSIHVSSPHFALYVLLGITVIAISAEATEKLICIKAYMLYGV
jgi:hypothetical protein